MDSVLELMELFQTQKHINTEFKNALTEVQENFILHMQREHGAKVIVNPSPDSIQ